MTECYCHTYVQIDINWYTWFCYYICITIIIIIINLHCVVVFFRTGLSHPKSALALEGVLGFLEERVPEIAPVMDGLLAALHASQVKRERERERRIKRERQKEKVEEIKRVRIYRPFPLNFRLRMRATSQKTMKT